MKKFLALALLLGAFSLTASAQKFALVDMEYILSNIPAYERANEQLNQISRRWQDEVEALDNEAKALYKNYQNEAMFLSETQKKEREEAIVAKEKEAADLKKKYFGPEGELYKKRSASPKPSTKRASAPNASSTSPTSARKSTALTPGTPSSRPKSWPSAAKPTPAAASPSTDGQRLQTVGTAADAP